MMRDVQLNQPDEQMMRDGRGLYARIRQGIWNKDHQPPFHAPQTILTRPTRQILAALRAAFAEKIGFFSYEDSMATHPKRAHTQVR